MSGRPKRSKQKASPRESRSEKFIRENEGTLVHVWEQVLELIDVSELPIFRRDEQDGAFKRFVYTLIDKFYNKVRIVDDDDSVTEVSEEEDEASEETLSTSVEDEELELESDDESEFQEESEEEDSEDIDSELGSDELEELESDEDPQE